MSDLRKAAQQALEALEAVDSDAHGTSFPATVSCAITALCAALEQAEPEPVAWRHKGAGHFTVTPLVSKFPEWEPLYTALVQDQDPELSAALGWPGGISDPVLDRETLLQQVARLVERAHGIGDEK